MMSRAKGGIMAKMKIQISKSLKLLHQITSRKLKALRRNPCQILKQGNEVLLPM